MLKKIDQLINSVTMYRLVLYSLLVLAAISFLGSFINLLPYSPAQIIFSLALLGSACQLSNFALAKIFRCQTNSESATITSLILFFLFVPAGNMSEFVALLAAGLIAMTSKFVLTSKNAHLFNPAAIAAVLLPLLGLEAALWWVATPLLLPVVVAIAVLVTYKTKKLELVTAFLLSACLSILCTNWKFLDNSLTFMAELLLSWPIIFFAGVLLT